MTNGLIIKAKALGRKLKFYQEHRCIEIECIFHYYHKSFICAL